MVSSRLEYGGVARDWGGGEVIEVGGIMAGRETWLYREGLIITKSVKKVQFNF